MSSRIRTDTMEMDDSSVTICRLCAEMTSSKSFMSLYTDDKKEQTVTKQMNQLVNNLISPDDGLPQEVCLNCADNVAKFYFFVSNIIETQNKLRRIMLLPEIKKMDTMNTDNEVNNFLKNDHISKNVLMHVGSGSEKTTSRERNRRFTERDKINPNKENKRTLREASSGDYMEIDEDDIVFESSYNHKTASNSDFSHQLPRTPRPTIAERRDPNCLRIYDCSICFDKFKVKNECISHVINNHPHVKRPASPSIIWESDYSRMKSPPRKFLNQEKLNELKTAKFSDDHCYNRKDSRSSASASTPTPQPLKEVAQPKPPATPRNSGPSSAQTKEKKVPNLPGSNYRRKVLAIEGFYKEVQKQVSRLICDVCGRAMASKFAFVRHLREHDYLDGDDEEQIEENPKEIKPPKPIKGYCKPCKRLVPDSSRHKMYHSINKLESTYPSVVKLLNLS